MGNSINLAAQVFGLGFVISLMMAIIIKVLLKVIRLFIKPNKEQN